jgi:flavin-dependent dehydrogenase
MLANSAFFKAPLPITTRQDYLRCRFQQRRGAALRLQATAEQTSSITERIFKELECKAAAEQSSNGAGGAGGATTYADLKRLDAAWQDLRTRTIYGLPPNFVRNTKDPLPATPALDVIIAGGTLGIFLAASLQRAGLKVAVVERGPLKGRSQEWNISRNELAELVDAGALSSEDAEASISIEFNPVRAAFHGYKDVWTRDVLNLGVSPEKLIAGARRAFETAGGLVVEKLPLTNIWVHPNGIQVRGTDKALAGKLLIDCMGHQSPIVRQIRHGQKPDGICCVVGTCARGFDPEKNVTGDVIVTNSPSEPPFTTGTSSSSSSSSSSSAKLSNLQTFWEAFPAGSDQRDRTTYMFTYIDAAPERPSLEALLEHYWQAMPEYQNVYLDDLEIRRILFGAFPTYKDSPLPPQFDRILAVGDASGIQSPLSFGGLAAMARHISRLTSAITEAVDANALKTYQLKYINAYNPSLSAAWMMQRSMSIPADLKNYDVDFINRLLGGNFDAMEKMGDATLKPFLQDVIQPVPLGKTLVKQITADPLFVLSIFGRVGVSPLLNWMVHYIAMVVYSGAYTVADKYGILGKTEEMSPWRKYIVRRAVQRWQFGSGLDFKSPAAQEKKEE